MRKARVYQHGLPAGDLEEQAGARWQFTYLPDYQGPPVSLTMPLSQRIHAFATFPPFFEGLLPEGVPLAAMLRRCKLDRDDLFGQLVTTGSDLVGAVTVEAAE